MESSAVSNEDAPRRGRRALVITGAVLGGLALVGTAVSAGVLAFREARPANASPAASETSVGTGPTPMSPSLVSPVFAGEWSGAGTYQSTADKRRPFQVRIELIVNSRAGTTRYAGQDCDGVLQVETVTPDLLMAAETLTRGEQCAETPAGFITLKLRPDGKADFFWYGTQREQMLEFPGTAQQKGLVTRRV